MYIPEDGILHSHRRENLKSSNILYLCITESHYKTAQLKEEIRAGIETNIIKLAITGLFFH
jgi:hypothetical protein